jgi:hypothetical protein
MVRAQSAEQRKTKNPLDDTMTRAQVARRRFKSSLPRKIGYVELTPFEAVLRTGDMLVRFLREVESEGLDGDTVQVGLVFCQPKTKGKEHILAETIVLPGPEKIGAFADRVLALDKPVFLGLLFLQRDPEATKARDEKQASVMFGCEFTKSHDAEARLLAARHQQTLGGLKSTAN